MGCVDLLLTDQESSANVDGIFPRRTPQQRGRGTDSVMAALVICFLADETNLILGWEWMVKVLIGCRSPSPEPIYNHEGKRLNTREMRTRRRLEEERHKYIQEMMDINIDYKPPPDYKYVLRTEGYNRGMDQSPVTVLRSTNSFIVDYNSITGIFTATIRRGFLAKCYFQLVSTKNFKLLEVR